VYHNLRRYQNVEVHQDIWSSPDDPYNANEKEIYIKLETDPEAIEKVNQEEREERNIGISNPVKKEEEEPGEESKEAE
jgi:hypothetical protein